MERQDTDITLAEIREALDARDWDRAAGLFDDLALEEQDQLLPQLDLEDSADHPGRTACGPQIVWLRSRWVAVSSREVLEPQGSRGRLDQPWCPRCTRTM